MRNPYTRRRFPLLPLWITLAVLAAVGLTGFALYQAGVLKFWQQSIARSAEPPPGSVAVLLSVKDIPPYTRITRDHLFEVNGQASLFWLPKEQVSKQGIYTEVSDIIGRVLKRKKSKGYSFREDDFFPKGTRDGRVAAIEPGQRDFVLNVAKIKGFHGLQSGDRFDLVCTVNQEGRDKTPAAVSHLLNNGWPKNMGVKVVVEDGMVLVPVPPPLAPQEKVVQKQDPEVTIALKTEEIPILTRALAHSADLHCVARTGQVHESSLERTIEEPQPPGDVVHVELITNKKRETHRFYRAPGSDTGVALP